MNHLFSQAILLLEKTIKILNNEDGQGLVEYSLIGVIVSISAIALLSQFANILFTMISYAADLFS